jgi:hypothetical protein
VRVLPLFEQGGGVVSRRPRLQREKLVKIVAKEVRRLQRKGEANSINRLIVDGLMWISNSNRHTIYDLAATAGALAPIASDEDLVHVAYMSLWYKSGSERPPDAQIRLVLEPLGVRYAKCGCIADWASDTCCDNAVRGAA